MPRPTTKEELILKSNNMYNDLKKIMESLSHEVLSTPFNFKDDLKKNEAHWNRDETLKDVLIHLHEWHLLLLNWVESNINGEEKTFLPAPYNWKTYGEMNIEFFNKHKNTSLDNAKKMFESSHLEVMKLVDEFNNEQLFTKNVYRWVGGSTLGSYFVSTTSSHYEWAIKKIKAHLKNCKV